MKNLMLTLLALLFLACEQKNSLQTTSPYTIRTYQLQVDEALKSIVFSRGYYYGLLANGKFICLNRKFQLDSVITKVIGQQEFDLAYLSQDQLIAAKILQDSILEEYILDQDFKWHKRRRSLSTVAPKKEIEPFSISHCCVGEFGGAIFFKDNTSGRVFSCPATCVVAINKIANHYYITSSLAHSPSSEILLIKSPRALYELHTDSLKNACNWWAPFVHFKDGFAGMKKFEIGTKKLLDTIGLLVLASFERQGELYHLCSDQNRSFLGKLDHGKMQMLDSIFTENLWRYQAVIGATPNRVSFTEHPTRSGFFAIQEDTISIVSIRYRPNY